MLRHSGKLPMTSGTVITFAFPLMSSLATGTGVGVSGKPIPTFVPLSKICEVLMSLGVSNLGIKFTVPPAVVTLGSLDAFTEAVLAAATGNRRELEGAVLDGSARLVCAWAKAEGGKPPNVSASPAFRA